MALVLLAIVQIASFSVYRASGEPGSFPQRLPARTGAVLYGAIARVAPAPYAIDMQAYAAFARGDLDAAQRDALRLPRGNTRAEWLGRIARARGDGRSALRFFINANDAAAAQAEIDAGAAGDLARTIAAQRLLTRSLARTRDHPDAVAESMWHLGQLYDRGGDAGNALRAFRQAVQLSPLNGKYLLTAGYAERRAGNAAAAKRYFERAVDLDPASASQVPQ